MTTIIQFYQYCGKKKKKDCTAIEFVGEACMLKTNIDV